MKKLKNFFFGWWYKDIEEYDHEYDLIETNDRWAQ